MSDNLRQRRLGPPHSRCGGAAPWTLAFALLASLDVACARFGFERLDSNADAGLDGSHLVTGADADVGLPGAGGNDTGAGGSSGSGNGGSGDSGDDAGGGCSPCPCVPGAVERLGEPNYPGNDLYSPALSSDGLRLYAGLVLPGAQEQIVLATRSSRGASFGQGMPLPPPVFESTEGTPYLSVDSLTLYFYSRRAGGAGDRDLYFATRASESDELDDVTELASLNTAGLDHKPWLSPDQLSIHFVSDRAGSIDIWRSTRGSTAAAFDPPEEVTELNTPSDEGGVTLTPDGLEVILASNRPGGAGARDLYRATRANTSTPFSNLEPLDDLNTPDNEIDPALSADGTELYFASNRGGNSELFRLSRSCPR